MSEFHDNPTLKDLDITHYELLNESGRWDYTPRFIGPLHQEQLPLDESILQDIDNALRSRVRASVIKER
jgi:hypothetical protein